MGGSHHKRLSLLPLTAFLLALISGVNSPAQTPSSTTQSDGGDVLFRTQVDRVLLYAAVFDRQQRLVTGLSQQAFRVYQDGKLQRLSGFSNQDIPVSMGIAVDSSASMTEMRTAVNAAALALVQASHSADEVFIVDFKDTVELTQDFTNDIALLERGLSKVRMWGGTAVMDAMRMSVDHLRKGAKEKRVLLVITDGEDDSSEIEQDDLLKLLRESDVTVYAIGLLSDAPSNKRKSAQQLLQEAAKVSGGASYFPGSVEQVEALARQIAHDIRNQYVFEFPVPANTKSGYHKLRVDAESRARGKLTVRTRPGYVYQPSGDRPAGR
ncbi:MAG: VWA domain-containing protein [Acidobacteria bacterium]|nr:VWA domain-containing protein [Acidobacteriota bacterium]